MARDAASVVRRAYRAFAERDVATLREISRDDVEIVTMTGMLAGRDEPYRGHDGVESYIRDVMDVWDEIELVPVRITPLDDDRVLVEGRVRVTRETRMLDLPNAWLWELEGGKVRRTRVLGDPAAARDLLGE